MQRIAVIDANRVVGQASGRIISSMTANGDPLLNGSTTNITAGQNYNVAISGSGLEGLSADDFTLPAGTTVTIGSMSNTQAQVVINNAQAGALVIKDGSTRTLVITAGGTTIGSITLVSQSGGGNDDDDDGAQ